MELFVSLCFKFEISSATLYIYHFLHTTFLCNSNVLTDKDSDKYTLLYYDDTTFNCVMFVALFGLNSFNSRNCFEIFFSWCGIRFFLLYDVLKT